MVTNKFIESKTLYQLFSAVSFPPFIVELNHLTLDSALMQLYFVNFRFHLFTLNVLRAIERSPACVSFILIQSLTCCMSIQLVILVSITTE